ncbi:carbohydrate porin [Fimbriiglobus ruber]|uniref:OmpA-like transmembrane domain n=1 Tax=Fimbriiglobus ruber TaxID=1908690 RepID=A0A225E374_9BACT|nr:carbohydrate porin [Fimbriiglobus ruber]OWK45248.1 OmpA-like transmembrane domain [Fimbriiglobus ruber]
MARSRRTWCGFWLWLAVGGLVCILVPPARGQAPDLPIPVAPQPSPAGKTGSDSEAADSGKKNPDEGKKKDEKENGDKKDKDDKDKDKDKDKEKDKDDKDKDKDKDKAPDWYNVHAQATVVSQGVFPFRSPYMGPNSLASNQNLASTATATLFLAARPFRDTEIIFNPEMAAGGGLGNAVNGTTGIAGFPNGEATRTGIPQPTPYLARLLVKQTFGLGGEQESLEDEQNQVAGKVDIDRVVVRVGKMSATDLFDDNAYSHDPRTQFLNWALMYNGAWDYPANVRGYTYGGGIELNRKDWTLRYGIFAEPAIANGAPIDPRLLAAHGQATEYEQRFKINDHPGSFAVMAYMNNAHMGNYRLALAEAAAQPGGIPDIAATRSYRIKYGFGITAEQELTKDVGLFGRAGWNDGQSETWAFTEIDQTVSGGVLIKGTSWGRPDDRLGIGAVANGLSNAHRDYLEAGGVGFIIGDGHLHYAPEEIVEVFYNFQLRKGVVFTLGTSGVNHPAYNQDRGPLAIWSVRLHLEY